MKTQKWKTKSTEELLLLYESAAKEHGKATEEGNYKVANRAHDMVVAIRRELMDRGCERMLIRLLSSPNDWVKHWAATHLLQTNPEEAVPVLENLSNGNKGYLRLGSEVVLKEWRAGRLRLA